MSISLHFLAVLLIIRGAEVYCGTHDNSISSDEFPTISPIYITQGTLYIPYAEIEEPFSAWVDTKNGKSRIDFYGGVSKTYQLGSVNNYGVMRKIVPMTTDSVNSKLTCFEVNGTAENKIGAQSIIPDTTGFTYAGREVVNGLNCKKYSLVETKGQKVNKYNYWIRTLLVNDDKED